MQRTGAMKPTWSVARPYMRMGRLPSHSPCVQEAHHGEALRDPPSKAPLVLNSPKKTDTYTCTTAPVPTAGMCPLPDACPMSAQAHGATQPVSMPCAILYLLCGGCM